MQTEDKFSDLQMNKAGSTRFSQTLKRYASCSREKARTKKSTARRNQKSARYPASFVSSFIAFKGAGTAGVCCRNARSKTSKRALGALERPKLLYLDLHYISEITPLWPPP